MSKVSLKITIAGRTYPLNVPISDEEKVTKAAADINKAVELLRKNYAVNDNQDLIAMSALQLLAKAVSENVPSTPEPVDYTEIEDALSSLSSELDGIQ
ncbi:MAG: cell division protein ZapA [Flavobacteriales bacterium]